MCRCVQDFIQILWCSLVSRPNLKAMGNWLCMVIYTVVEFDHCCSFNFVINSPVYVYQTVQLNSKLCLLNKYYLVCMHKSEIQSA